MANKLTEPVETGAEDSRIEPAGAPRTSRRTALAATVAGCLAGGAAIGAAWAFLAPPVREVVALTRSGDRVRGFLGNEADHFFVAPALLVLLLATLAVVVAAAVWQWRAHRGPAMVGALVAGCTGGAALAALVGARLVLGRYGTVDVGALPLSQEHRVDYVVEAPPVFFGHSPAQIAASLLLPAAVAALVYGIAATWAVRDDLGGYPPIAAPGAAGPADPVTPPGSAAPPHP